MYKKSILALAIASFSTLTVPNVFAQSNNQGTQEDASEAEEVERITVISRGLNLYRQGDSNTGKLTVDPLNSTQIIQSINASLIEDQGARDALDLYRNIAGVSFFSYAGVTARGFRQEEIFFDGLRGDPYVGFNVPQLFNVERVDFLKGPAGMLYGPGNPGGLFNYITKKPKSEFAANVRGILGTDSRYGVSGEITGEIAEGHSARAGVFYEELDNLRVFSNTETIIVDLGYSVDLSGHLFTAQYTFYGQDLGANRLRGVPVDDDGNFLVDPSWNHNEASDFLNLESDVFQFLLEGDISDSLSYDAKLRFISNEQEQEYHEPRALIDTDGDDVPDLVGREFRDQLREEDTTAASINFVYEGEALDADHRVAFGVEYFEGEFNGDFGIARLNADFIQRFLTGTSLPSDIIPLRLNDPNYGETNSDNYDVAFFDSDSDEEQTGIYALNEFAWEQYTFVAGLRYDDYDTDNNVSFRVGGIYKPTADISLFIQYADSFIPQSAGTQVPEVGGPFDPTTGTIIEAGVNADLFDGSTLIRASIYQIKRENILQNTGLDIGGDGEDDLAPIGEVTSDGFEVEFISDLTENWVLSLSYAYNDARVTADAANGGGISNLGSGDRFTNAPENTFGFWTRYQVPHLNLAFAFGGNFVDEQLAFSRFVNGERVAGQTVQDFFIFDTSIIWEVENYKVLFRIDNLFDKEYATSGFLERTGHFPGEERQAFVELTYKF